MSVESDFDLKEQVISMLERYSGRKNIQLDQMIGRDVGINGSDGVQILFELEDKFGVDLNPLIDANTIFPQQNWFDRLIGRKHGRPRADLTVSKLIDYIASERRRTATS